MALYHVCIGVSNICAMTSTDLRGGRKGGGVNIVTSYFTAEECVRNGDR